MCLIHTDTTKVANNTPARGVISFANFIVTPSRTMDCDELSATNPQYSGHHVLKHLILYVDRILVGQLSVFLLYNTFASWKMEVLMSISQRNVSV